MTSSAERSEQFHLGRASVFQELAHDHYLEWTLYGKSNDLTLSDVYKEKAKAEMEKSNG